MRNLICILVLGIASFPIIICAMPLWVKTLSCEEYTVTITENPKNVFNLKLVSPKGVINLSQGRQVEPAIVVFSRGNTEYWITAETLSADTAGVLEIYQNGQPFSLHNCR